jgi:hypothetical protein
VHQGSAVQKTVKRCYQNHGKVVPIYGEKVKLSVCLLKHRAMKLCGGVEEQRLWYLTTT